MEEAPSVAAMTNLRGLRVSKSPVKNDTEPKNPGGKKKPGRYGCNFVSRSYYRCLALRPAVDELQRLTVSEDYPPSPKQQPRNRADILSDLSFLAYYSTVLRHVRVPKVTLRLS